MLLELWRQVKAYLSYYLLSVIYLHISMFVLLQTNHAGAEVLELPQHLPRDCGPRAGSRPQEGDQALGRESG